MSNNNGENVLPISGNGRVWELTVYDQFRTPHEPFTDNSEITVSPRSLNSELMCPICLDMLKNTMTTKECLHRFCQECITTALRSGNKECPTCRKKLVSKRSLRPDPNFDSLIAKIYPNREEYEQMQERALLTLKNHHSTEALQKSIEEGMKLQAELRKIYRVQSATNDNNVEKKKKRKRDPNNQQSDLDSTSVDMPASEISGTSVFRSKISEMELILRPHPDLENMPNLSNIAKQTRYLKTTANATIDHLAEYLMIRIRLDCDEANRCASNDSSFSSLMKSANSILSTPPLPPPPTNNNQAPPPPASDLAQTGGGATGADQSGSRADQSPTKPDQSDARVESVDQSGDAGGGVSALEAEPSSSAGEKRQCRDWCKIFVAQAGNSQILTQIPGDSNVEQVRNRFWKIKKPLELHFFIVNSSEFLTNQGSPPSATTAAPRPQNETTTANQEKASGVETTPTKTQLVNDENRPTTTTIDDN